MSPVDRLLPETLRWLREHPPPKEQPTRSSNVPRPRETESLENDLSPEAFARAYDHVRRYREFHGRS